MPSYTWHNFPDDEYVTFEHLLQGPEYEPEKDPNNQSLPMPSRERKQEPVRKTFDEWREVRIQARECPMPGCSGHLDDDFFCSFCANVSLPASMKDAAVVSGGEPVPAAAELPLAGCYGVDEFAPADMDAA